jgi:hypothetical protein
VRGLGGAGESSVGATVDATGSGHALAIACKVPRQRAHGSGCTAGGGAPGTVASRLARFTRRGSTVARPAPRGDHSVSDLSTRAGVCSIDDFRPDWDNRPRGTAPVPG